MENQMFCFQCQETAKGTGCNLAGVCGKKAATAGLQDLLIAVVRGLGRIDHLMRQQGVVCSCTCVSDFMVDALFATISCANYYPELKKYPHLHGNYGNAWWRQREEFAQFNGPIVFTTNCIVPPAPGANYADRVFTTNSTGFPGWKHIVADEQGVKDFSEVIAMAKTCQPPTAIEQGEIVGGFAHAQVFALADKIVEAVKGGAIRRFFVMGGCDGRMKSRSYYEEFAKALPKDCVILTSGCAKYKYNKLQLGDIGGIPRVLDAGQCNDSYSWAVVALKLKEIFGCDDINENNAQCSSTRSPGACTPSRSTWRGTSRKPSSSCFAQGLSTRATGSCVIGVKNIHIGPTLPAFLSPCVLKVLVDYPEGELNTAEAKNLGLAEHR